MHARLPWTFSRSGAPAVPGAPTLGQHTGEALTAVGLDEAAVRSATGRPHHPAGEPHSGPPA